jgi:tellurite resistance protein TehA-like permease
MAHEDVRRGGCLEFHASGRRYVNVCERGTKPTVANKNCIGGGIQAAGTLEALHTGEKLIIAGLFCQLFFFAFFIVVAGIFHYRLVNNKPLQKRLNSPTYISSPGSLHDLPWKRHLYNLYLTSGLIMIRSIFRVIEYLQGNAGYLLSHEVFLYVFDAILMLAVMVLFNWVHPSEVTEASHKRKRDSESQELRNIRAEYLA